MQTPHRKAIGPPWALKYIVDMKNNLLPQPLTEISVSTHVCVPTNYIRVAASLGDLGGRWCRRGGVEPDALKEWRIGVFRIIDARVSFCSRGARLLPPRPGSSFRHLGRGVRGFRVDCVLVPADGAADGVVVV